MTDPIKEIEDRQAWLSFGRQAALLYKGAESAGLEGRDALRAVSAFVEGMFRAQRDDEQNQDRSHEPSA